MGLPGFRTGGVSLLFKTRGRQGGRQGANQGLTTLLICKWLIVSGLVSGTVVNPSFKGGVNDSAVFK